jgi:hypothetical protein
MCWPVIFVIGHLDQTHHQVYAEPGSYLCE